MDPITHITSGALAARVLRPAYRGKALALYGFCMLGAWLPDIDNFVGLSPEQYLIHHRGATHSIFFILAAAPLLALAFRPIAKNFGYWRTTFLAAGLLAMHLWLDVVTTYGTQLLAPLSRHRFALPGVFIIDPVFTLSLLGLFAASLVRGRRAKKANGTASPGDVPNEAPAKARRRFPIPAMALVPGRGLAAAGLILVLAWPLGSLGVRASVVSSLPGLLADQGVSHDRIHVTTDALSPIFWKVIVEDGDTLRVASTSLVVTLGPLEFEDFPKADPGLLADLGRQESMFATWSWFSAYPAQETRPGPDGGQVVVFKDLRFFSMNPVLKKIFPGRNSPFNLTATLDSRGGIVDYAYRMNGHKSRPYRD